MTVTLPNTPGSHPDHNPFPCNEIYIEVLEDMVNEITVKNRIIQGLIICDTEITVKNRIIQGHIICDTEITVKKNNTRSHNM
jgi:hypothetical protein